MTLRQALLLNLITGLILCFATFLFTRANTTIDKNNEVIKNKADITFVIDQDNQIKDKLKDHMLSDDKRWDQLFNELQGMKGQQAIIIQTLMTKK